MKTTEFNYLLQNLKYEDNFEKFYRECYPLIVKYSDYIFGGKNFGNDIAQDIFKYLFIHDKQPYVRRPRAWLFTLCKNAGLKYVDNNTVELNEAAPYTSFTERYDCGELESILDGLSSEEKDVIILKHIVGFSLKEIAILQNRTYASVLKQHNRVLLKLKKKMSKKNK